MKKMITILMIVFGLSAVFAKPTVFQVGNSQVLTDDENKPIVYTGTEENFLTLTKEEMLARMLDFVEDVKAESK